MMSEEGDIDDIVDSALRGFWQSVKSESKVSQSQAAPPIFAAAGLGHAGVSDLPPGGMKEDLEKLASGWYWDNEANEHDTQHRSR